jgi:hypothetical protein
MLTSTSFEQIWELQTNSHGLKCNQNIKDKDYEMMHVVHPEMLLPTPKEDHLWCHPLDIIRFPFMIYGNGTKR